MPAELTWYIARSSGLVAWALTFVATLWGLLLVSRVLERRPSPAWLHDLHRHLSLLTVVLTGVHVFAIWIDTFVEFTIAEVLVPMASDHQRTAVALGVVAMWAVVVVDLSGRFRHRLSSRVFRTLHTLSVPVVILATAHGLMIGTDLGNPLVVVIGFVLAAEVLLIFALRCAGGRRPVALARSTG